MGLKVILIRAASTNGLSVFDLKRVSGLHGWFLTRQFNN